MKRYKVFFTVAFLGLVLAGCKPEVEKVRKDGAEKSASGSRSMVDTQPTTDTCRYDEINHRPYSWWLRKASTIDDFVSKTTASQYDFDIIDSIITAPTHEPIQIIVDDRIVITKNTSTSKVELLHTRNPYAMSPFSGFSADLTMDVSGFWAEGQAEVLPRTSPPTYLGKYIVYLLPDRVTCRHERPSSPCRQFHFEYFKNGLATGYPVVGVNILPYADPKCRSGGMETDDGDGDEGLR